MVPAGHDPSPGLGAGPGGRWPWRRQAGRRTVVVPLRCRVELCPESWTRAMSEGALWSPLRPRKGERIDRRQRVASQRARAPRVAAVAALPELTVGQPGEE